MVDAYLQRDQQELRVFDLESLRLVAVDYYTVHYIDCNIGRRHCCLES